MKKYIYHKYYPKLREFEMRSLSENLQCQIQNTTLVAFVNKNFYHHKLMFLVDSLKITSFETSFYKKKKSLIYSILFFYCVRIKKSYFRLKVKHILAITILHLCLFKKMSLKYGNILNTISKLIFSI